MQRADRAARNRVVAARGEDKGAALGRALDGVVHEAEAAAHQLAVDDLVPAGARQHRRRLGLLERVLVAIDYAIERADHVTRDAAEAVAREASEARMRDMLREAEAAEAAVLD